MTLSAEYGQGSAPGHAAPAASGASRIRAAASAATKKRIATPNPANRRESRGAIEFSRLSDDAIASMRALEIARLSVFVT